MNWQKTLVKLFFFPLSPLFFPVPLTVGYKVLPLSPPPSHPHFPTVRALNCAHVHGGGKEREGGEGDAENESARARERARDYVQCSDDTTPVHASSSLHVIGSCTCTSRGSDRLCSRAVLVHVRGNRRVGKGRGASRERAESSWRSEDGLPQSVCIPHRGCFVSKDAGVWPTARHFKFRVVGSAFPV